MLPVGLRNRRALRGGLLMSLVVLTTVAQLASAGEELVEVTKLEPTLRIDVKYATADNFMKEKMYPVGRVYLRPEVAARVVRVQRALQKKGLGLKIFDGYRPLSIQKKMFAKFPLDGYVMDPKKGSNHNRGAAVDVTLVDKSGKEMPMPSAYDEFTERAHVDFAGGTDAERENRRVLQDAMKAEGFMPIRTEWWHFDDPDKAKYSLLDIPIETLTQN